MYTRAEQWGRKMSHFGDQKRKYIVCGLLSITCVFKALFLHHVPLERSTDDEAGRQAGRTILLLNRLLLVYEERTILCTIYVVILTPPARPSSLASLLRGSRDTLDGWLAGW